MMLIIGLTGSIGMGKSTAAARFRERGIAVFDADAEVHRLYDGSLVATIESAFPGTTSNGAVDRAKLGAILVQQPERFQALEAIVHPHVRASQKVFLQKQAEAKSQMTVLEIPLLFESGAAQAVDVTIVVSAGDDVQRRRVLARPGMSQSKLDMLFARQMSDAEKRRHADFVVDTSGSVANCHNQIDAILDTLNHRVGTAYEQFWR